MEDEGEGMKDEVRGQADGGWEDKEARGDRKPDRVLRDSIQVAGGKWQARDLYLNLKTCTCYSKAETWDWRMIPRHPGLPPATREWKH